MSTDVYRGVTNFIEYYFRQKDVIACFAASVYLSDISEISYSTARLLHCGVAFLPVELFR